MEKIRSGIAGAKWTTGTVMLALSLFIAAAATAGPAAVAASTYRVTFANGNTVSVNSYSIKDDRVILGFPVGKAEVALSEVISITEDGGEAVLLQEKGEYIPYRAQAVHPQPPVNNYSYTETDEEVIPYRSRGAGPEAAGPAEDRKWEPVYYSEQVAEIDGFIDRMFEAEDKGREVSDAEVDAAFAAFLDEDPDNSF